MWVQRVVNATNSGAATCTYSTCEAGLPSHNTGVVDGAFVDGNRGGWSSSITGPCSPQKRSAWAEGLGEAMKDVASRLGPGKTLISNYPTPEALAVCQGGMMERGGAAARAYSSLDTTR